MNVKKQQMQLQLQLQQPQRRHDRTGFEALLDQPAPVAETSPPGGASPWSTGVADAAAGRYDHPHPHLHHSRRDADHSTGSPTEADDATAAATAARPGRPQDEAVTTPPPPPSPALSLPSPYYDRNPGFPVHHHHHRHHHHHVLKSPPPPITAAVPLGNVQNVVYSTGADHQDLHDDGHYANNSKQYYYQRHNNNYKSSAGGLADGRDDDKENIKQRDTAECLQQQLDEVLQACVDYEERNKSRQQAQSESSGNTSPGTATTTPPHQNRIKTNGSLPRDSKKSSTETSSPTSPLSPMTSPLSPMTSPLSPMTSPLSPSSTWPSVTTPSPPTLSPLSLRAAGGDSDSVFLESDNLPPSSPATCGSPRTRIRTLVPSSTAAAEDLNYSSDKDRHRLGQSQHNGHDGGFRDGFPTSSADGLSSKSPDQPPPQMQLRSTFLQSQSHPPPSWQTTTMWLRSSPFAVDSKDGVMGATASPTFSADRAAEAAEQRRKLLVELSAHKSRLVELHLRREEVDRELIIETALLRAELDVADDETRQSDNIVDGLDRAVADCRQKMDACTVKQQDQRTAADSQLAGHRRTLQGLRKRLESIEDDDDALKTEIRSSIDKQTELLDAEQKLYEDVEFGLLEEEAGWLARREELHRDRAAAVAVRRARRARAEWLRAQLDQLRSVGDDQLRALRADINTATLSIQQGHKKLLDLDATATAATNSTSDQYRGRPHQQLNYDAEHQPPKSLEWSWDQQLKSPVSPRSPSSLSWDLQPPRSPWFSTAAPVTEDFTTANNVNSLMTGSMTTTCCSSIGSSGGEDDCCARPVSDDSISRMSMSTIFDGGATIKLRPKNKTSPSDITKRPLTRYLPIRYDGDGSTENRMAFDLRAHIESAGHQLDDDNSDRHFWIDSTSCRGYLKKLSGAGAKNARRGGGRKWLKRWFVFDRRSRTLSYYRRRSDDGVDAANRRPAGAAAAAEKKIPPRASIRFQDIQEVYVDHTNSTKGQGCAFVVKTAQRTFYLSAATGQAVRVWVDVIFTGAEGYREYLKASTQVDGGCTGGGGGGGEGRR